MYTKGSFCVLNRYLHINPTDEWKEQPNLDTPASNEQAPYKYPTSTPQVQDKLHTDDPNILRIVQAVGAQELSVKEIMDGIGLKECHGDRCVTFDVRCLMAD